MAEPMLAASEWSHPEATLRGRMIREVWDAAPFIRRSDAIKAVDALLAIPELRHLRADDA